MPADTSAGGVAGIAVARCGVLGSPIAHSLSPTLHRAAYAALGLHWQYDAHEVTEAQLPAFVASLDEAWRGLSLTMPLKQVAGDLCVRVEPLAAQLNSVNTMVRHSEGWSGHNTDVGGCRDALVAAGVSAVDSGVIVGAGATAASALAALLELGATSVDVLARSVERARWLASLGDDLGVPVRTHALGDADGLDIAGLADVLVSTIPPGAQPAYADDLAASARVVFDVIYEPRETPLLLAARRGGRTTVPGLDLLLYQAARQIVLMTGVREAPLAVMRTALG